MPSSTHGQPRVIHLGPRPHAADDAARRAPGVVRVRRWASVPGVTLLVAASLLWPFLVLAPLVGAGPAEVRLVQDDRTADLGVAYGPGGASPLTAPSGPVVDQASAALLKGSEPGLSGPGTVLDPSALAASGIPEIALRAYEAAAARLAAEDPGCGLPWWLLAAIGRVESNHGQFAGALLQQDGTSSPPVIGIPLDGRPGVALITDTDGGALDGDTTFDRAVGPMQFIPSTWVGSQADGDGDGTADPHDVADAALASGRYLCAGESRLGTQAGLRAAVFRYNHSDAYVDLVLAIGTAYASGAVPVIPAGDPAPAAGTPGTATAAPTAPAPTTGPVPTPAPTTSPSAPAPTTGTPTTSPTTPPTTSPTGEPTPTCTPAADPRATDPTATEPPAEPPVASPTDPPTGSPPTCPPCPTDAPTATPTDAPTPSPSCAVPTTSPTGTATSTP